MPRPRWRLQKALAAIAILAVALSGFAQWERARRDEQTQRHAMMRALPLKRVKKLFSQRGIAVLRGAGSVCVFQVAAPLDSSAAPLDWHRVRRSPTHRMDPARTRRFTTSFSQVLLDGTHYVSLPDGLGPFVGFRFERQNESLDVVFSGIGTPHIGVATRVTDAEGHVVHTGGGYRLESKRLPALIEDALEGALPGRAVPRVLSAP